MLGLLLDLVLVGLTHEAIEPSVLQVLELGPTALALEGLRSSGRWRRRDRHLDLNGRDLLPHVLLLDLLLGLANIRIAAEAVPLVDMRYEMWVIAALGTFG
jgi:hypothetical protein